MINLLHLSKLKVATILFALLVFNFNFNFTFAATPVDIWEKKENQGEQKTQISDEERTTIESPILSEDENNMPTFEVDSIELATPELFSDNGEDSSFNQDNNSNEPNIFDSTNSQDRKEDEIKEPEMFEENNQEEDFEIPAFLRRQKN